MFDSSLIKEKKNDIQLEFSVSIYQLRKLANSLEKETNKEFDKEIGIDWKKQQWSCTAWLHRCGCGYCKAIWKSAEEIWDREEEPVKRTG